MRRSRRDLPRHLTGRAISQRPDVECGRGLGPSVAAVAHERKRKSKRVSGRSGANDLVKRIRKLRWMGMEEEAKRLQAELSRKCAAADSVIATPRDTD
jgi:hypothetical protein